MPKTLQACLRYPQKLFSKIPLFLKLNFNKIELQVEFEISNVKFYIYFAVELNLNFQKILSGKICTKLNIANVEFHLKIYIEFDFEDIEFYTELDFIKIKFQNIDILLNSFKT